MMGKNTRTTILSVLGIVAAIGLMTVVGLNMGRRIRDGFSGRIGTAVTVETSTETEKSSVRTLQYDIRDFDTIHTSGGWIVEIRPGDDFDVTLTADGRVVDDIDVRQSGDTLDLELHSGFGSVLRKPTVLITMPDLEEIQCDGAAQVLVSGFDEDRLSVDIDGAASVRSEASRWQDLSLTVDGASTIDFSDSEVVNARIDMDGASTLHVTMDGGELTGTLNGVGNVIYGGEVSAETVRIGGIAKIRHE
jgi:hypothetical protein